MTVIVTGGAGFIGSHLVDQLLEKGYKVIVIDDFSLGNEKNLSNHKKNPQLQIIKKSITENLGEIFTKDIETVFHAAAIPRVQLSIQEPQETHEANVNGTLNILQYCRKVEARCIFSSSSSIYGDQDTLPLHEDMKPNPMSPYALHKLIGEHYCRLYQKIYNLETISLRYFNVFGPRQSPEGSYANLIPRSIMLVKNNQQPTIFGDGNQTRDFTYVTEVVRANLLAAAAKNKSCFGETFNIGSGKNISVNGIIKDIISLSKKNITPLYNPPVIEPRDTLANISKAKEMIGWTPKISFEQGLKETCNFFSQQQK